MNWTIITERPEYDDPFSGQHIEASRKECKIPFQGYQSMFYCYKRFRKYVVLETKVTGIWATDIIGVELLGGRRIPETEYDRLFTNVDDAIDWCVKKNQKDKIKVFSEVRWYER